MQIEWWYWIIAGFCCIGLELIIPSFTIIWFGLGALVISVASKLWPDIPPLGQVMLWLVVSVCFTLMWFKYLKPKGQADAGKSKEAIVGETGVIIRGTDDIDGRGIVKFSSSLLGTDEWGCCSGEILHVGDRVRVVDIEGHTLEVEMM